jgi:hypothetical protein
VCSEWENLDCGGKLSTPPLWKPVDDWQKRCRRYRSASAAQNLPPDAALVFQPKLVLNARCGQRKPTRFLRERACTHRNRNVEPFEEALAEPQERMIAESSLGDHSYRPDGARLASDFR